jgi:hypothetical protein
MRQGKLGEAAMRRWKPLQLTSPSLNVIPDVTGHLAAIEAFSNFTSPEQAL